MGKFKGKLKSFKEIVLNRKKQIGVIAIILIIIAIATTLIYKNIEQARMLANNPELAKAMTYDQVQEGEEIVEGTDGKVKFDAFFLRDLNGDGYAESIRGTSKEIGKEDTLYMEISVNTSGYLKDAKITINDGNYYFQTALPKDDELKDNYIGSNIKTIEFNQLNNGTQKMLTGAVKASINNNINDYSEVNSITLTGTYVTENNKEIPITKTVKFNIDWYGTTKATITNTSSSYNNYTDLDDRLDEENGQVTLDFSIKTQETANELIIKSNHVEAEIPQLNGYNPISVTYTGSNAIFNYDEQSKKVTIVRESKVSTDGTVTSTLSRSNSYSIRIIYPIEAYQSIGEETITIRIPVRTYYEGYNNSSKEFENPYVSNTALETIVVNYRRPTGEVARFDVTVGKSSIVSKEKPLRIYNGLSDVEKDDTYQVKWEVYTGVEVAKSNIVMKETENGKTQIADSFIKTNSNKESMENITTNIGIGISGADGLLKEDGWIKVYDDNTGDLLVTFTKENWNDYTSNNPYIYELPVKHIRIETSDANADSYFYIYNIKELDDNYITTNYTRDEFNDLQYIESNLVGYIGGTYINTDTNQASYQAPYSIAGIGLSNNTISTQTTEENEKIIITAHYNSSSNQVGWTDGSFLVKFPKEILMAEINNVEINNSNVDITSYELIEQDGIKFVKVNTENRNDTPQTYSITIDLDITSDPRIPTKTGEVELYASNEEFCDYRYSENDIYDVNDNLNTYEKINYDSTELNMISPNSLLTNQVGSNYDNKGSIVVSPQIADVRPAYGIVDQENEKEATIGVQIRNNYSSTISEIVILGKIPFEGNSYVLSGEDLGSTFTTKMTNAGIQIPEGLQQYATVYYSENENPDRDLTKAENGWKTANQITNWDNIKTFLIDLGNYVMPTGAEYVFNYVIKIPNGLEFNQASFSHHGVYFSLDTDQGKYRTQVEPNKLGFRIAEKFNLELTKYQTGRDKLVAGATYSFTDEGTGETKTAVTNSEGKLTINNLYAEKAYIIEEIKTPDDYELNSNRIRFIGHVDENGNITIEKTEGTTKEDIGVVKEEGEDYKVTVKVEDEVKASIKIHKTEQETDTQVQYVKYKLTGYNLSENGRILTTNINGEATINGLSVNQEYTLTETKAEGYYLADPIIFKIINENGTYKLETTAGAFKESTITEENGIPTITLDLEDEKIPTYSLQIIKQEKTINTELTEDQEQAESTNNAEQVTYLANAKFKLYKNEEEIGEYITDETGTVTIDNLYQYIEGKNEEATYTLKEVLAPEGYAKVKDITFKVQNTDGTLSLLNTDGTEEKYEVEGTTIKLTIEDSPSFRLVKKDKETQEPIANVKFAIYNVENGEIPATNSKGETLGTLETINGREYYTLTTDVQGVLTADLKEGLYKAVEIEAPEQYDIENQTYYFGIGASREGKEEMTEIWADSIGGTGGDYVNSIAKTSDGGCIIGGYFYSSTIKVGDEIIINNGYRENYEPTNDGIIVKYSEEGKVEWKKTIGGNNEDHIYAVAETSDGGYIAGGEFRDTIQVGDKTVSVMEDSYQGNSDGIIIKYNSEGEEQWIRTIGGKSEDAIQALTPTSDGGFIATGIIGSQEAYIGNEILTANGYKDIVIIKYNSKGEVEWTNQIGGSSSEIINSVVETSDGGYIAGGYFSSDEIKIENETVTNNGSSDGLIVKGNSKGEVEWIRSIGGNESEQIKSIAETSDGDYIAVGNSSSDEIKVENEVVTNNGDYDGIIIKYSNKGDIKWAKNIGGSDYDYISSVVETNDGGCILGGYFRSDNVIIGKDTITSIGSSIIKCDKEGELKTINQIEGEIESIALTSSEGILIGGNFGRILKVGDEKLTSNGLDDGMVIKLENQEMPIPLVSDAKVIGKNSSDTINSVRETNDGGYIVGGYFSETIQVENEELKSNGGIDGLIIKYNNLGEVEWSKNIGGNYDDYIKLVTQMSDGSYIAIGYFRSDSIKIGSEKLINNSYNAPYYDGNYYDGLIIKYNNLGEIEWADSFGGSYDDQIQSVTETSDGEILVGGNFDSGSIEIGNVKLTNNSESIYDGDGLIIKYNNLGEVEWAKNIGGSYDEGINSVTSIKDGGIVVGGFFESDEIQVGNDRLINKGNYDGMIIKYSNSGVVEWVDSFGGNSSESVNSVTKVSDGGIIIGGYFHSEEIQIENETLIHNSSSSYYPDGLIIKYNNLGEVEWTESFGGTGYSNIYEITETSEGEILVGGYFSGGIKIGKESTQSKGEYDGLIIRYNSNGKIQWVKSIGGNENDHIYSVAENKDGKVIAVGDFYSDIIGDNEHILENQGGYDGMILEIENKVGVPEVQELVVENDRKKFNITTDVNEIDGVKGGSISGEDISPYEKVKYGDNSSKSIIMTPEEEYEIIGITVNGEEWRFEGNSDGTYTMPTFENMTEDKHIVVTYALKDNKIIINKVDSEDDTPLAGATFKLDQLDERANPDNERIIGDIVANGKEYPDANIEKGEVNGVLGQLTNNGTYYFVENEDGALVPTNSKTYQTANGGSNGVGDTTANSYIPIDLSGKDGEYVVVVNASVSSESYDYGYATVNQNTIAPTYSTSNGRFMYISGTVDSKDYTSTTVLQGGQTYYLHLGYRKSSSTDTNEDQVVINSVKIYENKEISYGFVDNGKGGYESNNQGEDSTVANSYIPIDLTNYSGKYNLTVNANVSSQSNYDYGYATIKNNTTAPSYISNTGRFIYISGTNKEDITPTDYTTVLQGGQMYYLHLGYYKNYTTSLGDDKFTVNSIKVTLNDSELYHSEEITTNSLGQAITQVPFGKYQITEIVAPKGYELNSKPIEVEFRENGNHEFTIENNKTAKVLVHHYLKDENGRYTTTKVAEDELLEGKIGDKYTTSPKLDLSKYELEKNEEGNYVTPENAAGVYESGVIEIIYYYEEKEIPLTVHHYIEGTTEKVPLKDGEAGEDVLDSGKEGEEYHTSAIDDSLLSDDYELVEIPENSTGTYSGEEVTVTYYYKRVERQVILNKYDEDGISPLEGVGFEIQLEEDKAKEESLKQIVGELISSGNYYFENQGGKLISNNQQQNSTTANSYIKIDLTEKEDMVLKINAEVSSQSGYDYGYAIVNQSTSNPSYYTTTGRVFRISGQVEAKDYEYTLTGGKVYYLHFGYYKNSSTSSYDDTFTINSILINDINILDSGKIKVTTDSNGQIKANLESGEYIATEVEVPEGYDLPDDNETEFTVNKSDDVVTLNVTNTKTKGTVITHYYIEGTEEKVPNKDGTVVEDIVNTGNIGDIYATKEAENVAPNYEFVRTEGETSGEITEGTTEVIYYYKLKEPVIETPVITKESSVEKVTEVGQTIDYTINYKASIDDYIGNGTVTIVDYLPYEIDESKEYELAGGEYDKENKTITWTEEIGEIDAFTNGEYDVDITKEISLVYKDVDPTSEVVSNRVTGTVTLKTPKKEDTTETTKEIPAEYLVSIPVTKVWSDNENAAKKRPSSVRVVVKNGTEEVAQEELSDSNSWTYTFNNLPKYDETGKEISYVIEEQEVTSGELYFYNANISGSITNGYTITNTFEVPDEKVSVNVSKTWVDTTDQQNRRPGFVTVQLKANEVNVEGKTLELNEGNEWKGTFTDLDKYDSSGNEINYTVEEKDTENIFYTVENSSVSGNMENGYVITNTFTRPEDKITLMANKVWNDNTEQALQRPGSITLVVKNGDTEVVSKVVTSDNLVEGTTNKWSVEFTGLDKYDENGDEIQYTLEERETEEGTLHFYEAEESKVNFEDNQATIRNNFVKPDDTTNVKVTKVWNDSDNVNGRRPGSIVLKITGNGQEYEYTVEEADNWTHTFTDLPKYDDNGKEIEYTASEEEVDEGNLKFYTNDGVSGSMTAGYTITNTFTVPDDKIELTVNKVWVDNETQAQRRPDTVVINVLGENGTIVASHDLNVSEEESYTFTNLPKYNSETGKEINYTVEEKEKTDGGLYFYTGVVGNVENVSENSKEVTITNTFKKPEDTTDVTATKVWEDNNDEASKRPGSIKLLLKNGTETVGEQEVTGDTNTWTYTFKGVDKYNENGQEIVYTADEAEVKSGDLQFYNKTISGLTVTNEFTKDTTKVSVPVTKIWVDTEEQESRRPGSVRIILKANEIKVKEYDLTGTGDTWNYTFEDLPKYDSYNNIINYTVEEEEVSSGGLKFYSSSVDGTTITNTFTRPTDVISIEVTKKWNDQDNVYGKRPVSVRINVNNGTDVVQTAIVTKDNLWTYTFKNLPKYDDNGNEILYTISEEEVIENSLYYYTGESSLVTNKAGETDVKEATITNNMTKIPGTVVIKYKDKYTGGEISEKKTKEGIVGESFDVTEDVKEIEGYTLVEEPEEKTGTYTSETQEKTYYYAKDTRVIVKYLEKDDTPEDDSNNKVLADEIILGGYEGKSYTTNSKAIDGYTLVETKGNLNGTMKKEEQVVVYYYAKDTKVIVKYLEKDDTPLNTSDNKVLLPEKTIEGYVGKEYTTTGEEIPNYTLVEKTINYEGTMTEDVIEVVYYYLKDTSVTVRYLEKDSTESDSDNKELVPDITIDGYVGKDYETEQKQISGYTFVEVKGEVSGKMTEEPIEVIYYYAQNTKAKVEHIDRETGDILKEETTNGKVGDLFETHPEDFEGYVLVEEPENPDIIMDKTGNQVVKYYYAHVSAGVIEKHIDIISGELLDSAEHEGNEGDPYDISSKTFDGYDLVEEDEEGNSMLPDNSTGTMKRDKVIEVKYYYIKKATVVVKYVDENTGEEIEKEEIIEGHENDKYETEEKEIEDYNLTKTPDNSSGTMIITKNPDGTYDTEIEVIYYYKKISGGVIENHIDVDTNKKLATEEHKGNVGDEYDIPSREFSGYDLVTDMLPDNSKGTMKEQEIEVNYYYKKKAKVVVEYIDKGTGEKLDEEEINGHLGDEYKTEEKTFDGYDLIEKPSNGEGEMTEDEIVVKYYYARKTEVEVKYLEKGTEYEVATGETIQGYVGDKYETEQKDVPYYKFVEKTDNWEGKMTEGKITVIYYYEKEIFNLGVDKWVESVNVNGISSPAQSISSSDEIYKVDIHRSKADTADVKITYKIRITNKGELEGTVGKITDIIPAGTTFNQEDNDIYWDNNNGVLTTEDLKDEIIEAGEYKEIEVTLRVNEGSDNFGQKDNMVILTELNNPAGYEDIDKEDNNDTSSMILTIATGLDRNDRIVIIGIVQIVLAITIGLLLSYEKKEKRTKE